MRAAHLKKTWAFAITLAMALSAESAFAQSQAEDNSQPSADQLNLGSPVAEDELQVGQVYEVEKNGDWTVRCIKLATGKDPCEMYQLLSDNTGNPISEVTLFQLPDGQDARAGASLIVPLETALQRQLTIQVDNQTAKRYPFAFCNQVGCHARIGLTTEDIGVYRRGASATVSIVPMAALDQTVSVTMSLSGFTASYDKVAELNGQ